MSSSTLAIGWRIAKMPIGRSKQLCTCIQALLPILCLLMQKDDPLASLFARAKTSGIPMAAICKRAELAPTTPSRWKRGKNGATLDRNQSLNEALSAILRSEERSEGKELGRKV